MDDRLLTYPAFLHIEDGPSVGVTFPDFPGCVTQGDDRDEALRLAAEALSLHIEGMAEEGLDIPAPAPLSGLEIDDPALTVIALVSAPDPRRRERVNLSVAAADLARIDAAATRAGLTRSGFMVRAAIDRAAVRDGAL